MKCDVSFLTVFETSAYGTNTIEGGLIGHTYTKEEALEVGKHKGNFKGEAYLTERPAVIVDGKVYLLVSRDHIVMNVNHAVTV